MKIVLRGSTCALGYAGPGHQHGRGGGGGHEEVGAQLGRRDH